MKKTILLKLLQRYDGFVILILLASLSTSISLSHAQTTTVSGTVTDENNEGLPGVNVLIKGTIQGTVTDVMGNYRLGEVSPSDSLLFTSVGYVSQSVPVGNQSTVNVTLQEDIRSLQEVVVVGYTSVKKSDIAGAISMVDTDQLEQESSPHTSAVP